MKRTIFMLLILAGLLVCLTGCMFRGVDELYAVPRTSETNLKLQETINSVMGGAVGISPISGNNTQTIQLIDLDKDGMQEAVAFYRDSSDRPLKVAIFKQNEDEEYDLYAQIDW